jgi:hypothetical protein
MKKNASASQEIFMRSISFEVRGGVGGIHSQSGTLSDLLKAMPYLLTPKLVPPLQVVNDLLKRGISDAGMSGGCSWEPFEITPAEWDELKEQLISNRSDGLEYVPPPEWVRNINDWHNWVFEYRYGMPGPEFRKLEGRYRELVEQRDQALKDGNQELASELHLKAFTAGNELADLAMKNRPGKK